MRYLKFFIKNYKTKKKYDLYQLSEGSQERELINEILGFILEDMQDSLSYKFYSNLRKLEFFDLLFSLLLNSKQRQLNF